MRKMAKNSNGRIKLYGFLLTAAIILVSIGIAWATLSHGVGDNTKSNTKQDKCIEANELRIEEEEKGTVKQNTILEHIKGAVDRIEKQMDKKNEP